MIDDKEKEKALTTKEWDTKEESIFLCVGEWGENVPAQKRFALCEKGTFQLDYCPIDLVRGYSNPYFGYYVEMPLAIEHLYKERLEPIYNADTKRAKINVIRADWNFFNVEENEKFRVCTFEVSKDDGRVKIVSKSDLMSLKEHRERLEHEYCMKTKDVSNSADSAIGEEEDLVFEGIVVNGKVYERKEGVAGYACERCSFYDTTRPYGERCKIGECISCPLNNNEYFIAKAKI